MPSKYPSWEKQYQRQYRAAHPVSADEKARRNAARKLCPSVSREYQQRYRREFFAKHPEKYAARLARVKAWYRQNKSRILAVGKAYRGNNSEAIKGTKRKYYLANRDEISGKSKQAYAKNRSKRIADAARWVRENKDRHKAYVRNRYFNNPEFRAKHLAICSAGAKRRWETGIPCKRQQELRKIKRESVSEAYAREMLSKHSTIKAKDFPPELVELKQAEIRLRQELKNSNP